MAKADFGTRTLVGLDYIQGFSVGIPNFKIKNGNIFISRFERLERLLQKNQNII
jgi:hypothetical protein